MAVVSFPTDPLHTNISVHILDTVLCTYPTDDDDHHDGADKENLFNNQERL